METCTPPGECAVDVAELTLADLEHLDGSALGEALRRVLEDDGGETVAGFQSKIES
jgi:FXSXX-COOH protein